MEHSQNSSSVFPCSSTLSLLQAALFWSFISFLQVGHSWLSDSQQPGGRQQLLSCYRGTRGCVMCVCRLQVSKVLHADAHT